jgi:hypothetical protein
LLYFRTAIDTANVHLFLIKMDTCELLYKLLYKNHKLYLVSILIVFIQVKSYAQCLSTPTNPFPFTSSGTVTAGGSATTALTISAGTSCADNNAAGTFPGSGGSYRLPCNSFTLTSGNPAATTNIYVQSGQTLTISYNWNLNNPVNIYVESGGLLKHTAGGTFVTTSINVWGTMQFTAAVSAQANSAFYIGPSGYLSASGINLTFPSSGGKFLLDGGGFEARNIDINTQGSVTRYMCINNSGCFKVTGTIKNDEQFAMSSDGTGYLYWTNSAWNNINQPLIDYNNPVLVRTTLTDSTATTGNTSPARFCSTTDAQLNSSGVINATCKSKIKWAYTGTNPTAACNNPLPIILTFFKPTLTNEGVIVKWGTNSQWDSDYFIVEKSKNGIDWEYVSTLPSENGKYRYKEFSVTDPNPYEGDSYYRLVEVDKNGNRTVYATDFIHNDKSFDGFSIYPNPSNGSFIVSISGDSPQYQMSVFDVLGKNLGVFTLLAGKNEISTAFAAGIYIAKLKVGLDYYTQKLVVQ